MDKDRSEPAKAAVAGQLERGVRALDPERADFEAWVRGKDPEATDALWRDADDRDAYHYGCTQAAWEAWQAARAWVPMSQRKPKGGQLIVKRWRHGAVWAGTHNEGPKNEAFDEWKAL